MNGIGSSNHNPVIGGYPNNSGKLTLSAEIPNPVGIRDRGFLFRIFIVDSGPLAKLCNTKAMEATKPPTKPPPG